MRLRWFLALLAVVAAVAGIVYRSWVGAQSRAAVTLSITLDVPVLTRAAKVVTDEPEIIDPWLGAPVPTTVARPGSDCPCPAIVFVNGATARGRHHPHVQRLARGLARAGYLVLVPDLPGLRRGEITERTLRATVGVAEAAVRRRDVAGEHIGLVGVSVGASLALLVAEHSGLAERVTVVAGLAPFTDMVNAVQLATTGHYRGVPYEAEPFLSLAVARSLAASLPAGRDRRLLVAELAAIADNDPDPLAALRARSTRDLGPRGRALAALLVNRDPRRFDRLYGALPPRMRAALERLSPITGANRLRARVEIASAPHDKYFPVAESRALARAAPRVRITVTSTLAHAIPEPSLGDLADLLRFDAFVVRALRWASASGSD